MKWIKYDSENESTFPPLKEKIIIAYWDDIVLDKQPKVGIGCFGYRDKYGSNYVYGDFGWRYGASFVAWMPMPDVPPAEMWY